MGGKEITNDKSIHYSSGKDIWCTPPKLFNDLNSLWNFTLDAACMKETALCKKYFTPDDNSLIQDWSTDTVWLNPPYSDLKTWLGKAVQEYKRGATVVMLVPSRTDTIAFQNFAVPECSCICFVKGRITFIDPEETDLDKKKNPAPFPSCLLILDNDLTEEKIEYLKTLGRVMKNV
jgi:site-specific DNA-methyltransferase (adenine-specific)